MTRGDARGSAPDLATAAADDEVPAASPRPSPTRGGALTTEELQAAGVVVPQVDAIDESPPSSAQRPREDAAPVRRKRPVIATGPVPTRLGTGSWDDLVVEAQRISTGDASELTSPTRAGTLGWGTKPTARRPSSRTMAAAGPIRGGTQQLDMAEDDVAAYGDEPPAALPSAPPLDLDFEGLGDPDAS